MVQGAISKDNHHKYCHKKHQCLHLHLQMCFCCQMWSKKILWRDTSWHNNMYDMIWLLSMQMTMISLRIWFQLYRLKNRFPPYEPEYLLVYCKFKCGDWILNTCEYWILNTCWCIAAKFSFIIILLFDVNILIGIFLLIEIIILFLFLYTFNRISSIIHTLDFIHYVVTCTCI